MKIKGEEKERIAGASNKSYVNSHAERFKPPYNRALANGEKAQKTLNFRGSRVENIANKNPYAPAKYEVKHVQSDISKEYHVVVEKKE